MAFLARSLCLETGIIKQVFYFFKFDRDLRVFLFMRRYHLGSEIKAVAFVVLSVLKAKTIDTDKIQGHVDILDGKTPIKARNFFTSGTHLRRASISAFVSSYYFFFSIFYWLSTILFRAFAAGPKSNFRIRAVSLRMLFADDV